MLAGAKVLVLLVAANAINNAVDPYRVFGLVNLRGFNAREPRALEHGYLSKLASINAVRPERVLLGNSRMQVGLDPESPQWHDSLTPYNAALPGTGPETALSLMRAAVAAGRLREAVVGLEFLDFLADEGGSDSGTSVTLPFEDRAPSATPDVPILNMRTKLRLILSLDALLDSAYTVAAQRIDASPDLTFLGFTPMRDYAAMAKRDGYGAFFLQHDQEHAAEYLWEPKALGHANGRSSPEWQQVDELKQLYKSLELGGKFVIYPYHTHILELFTMPGLWSEFEDWKRELVRRLGPALEPGPGSRIVLWDFSGYSRYAFERVPGLGNRTNTMRWYWEAGHFKRELGDRIIARIRGGGDEGFGIRLDASVIDSALAHIRKGETSYRQQWPAEFMALSKLVGGM